MKNQMNKATAHECGHLLGLVANSNVLDGIGGHNPSPSGRRIMNPGPSTSFFHKLGRYGSWSWLERNAGYLKFILPKKEEEK